MPGIIIWMGKGRFWKSYTSKYFAFWVFCHKNISSQLKSSLTPFFIFLGLKKTLILKGWTYLVPRFYSDAILDPDS